MDLLDNKWQKTGYITLSIGVLLTLMWLFFPGYTLERKQGLLIGGKIIACIGLFLMLLSKEKSEDEMIQQLRFDALTISLTCCCSVALLNELIYFFGEPFKVKLIDFILTLLIAYFTIFKIKIKQSFEE